MDTSVAIGLNKIQQAGMRILYASLNGEIDAKNVAFAATDATWYASLSKTDPLFLAEHIPGDNFYAGHVPSLIDAPVGNYPNVSVIANAGQPQDSTDDWGEMYTLTLGVEIMCKSRTVEPDEDQVIAQLEVNARLQRTLEAVHAILATESNRTLDNTVPKIAATPSVIVSDVFARREEKSRGPKWFWQGARLEYGVDKYAGYDH